MPSVFITQQNRKLKMLDNNATTRTNSSVLGVALGTVHNWTHTDMSTIAQQKRLSTRGRKRKLTADQEKKIFEWIQQQAFEGLSTLAKEIIAYVTSLTGGSFIPKCFYISKLCKHLNVSSKTQKKRTAKQMRPTYSTEVEEFRNQLKEIVPLRFELH